MIILAGNREPGIWVPVILAITTKTDSQLLRRLLKNIFQRPIARLALRVSSSPRKEDIQASLSQLVYDIEGGKEEKGPIVPFDINTGKIIIFSDQHKGGGDLADDFHLAEGNYMSALRYYNDLDFELVNLGDCEELWENTPKVATEKNRLSLFEEAKFLQSGRYYRIFGNHDLEWKYAIQQNLYLKPIFGDNLKVFEGVIFRTVYNENEYSLFFTHGHQGDKKSDGNAFSKWVVAAIWTPIQRYLDININSVSDSFELVDKHNIMMFEWSSTQKNTIFISGHTHKPVFASLDHIDRLTKQLIRAEASNDINMIHSLKDALQKRKLEYAGKKFTKAMAHPSYFNTGCCCFVDGDITGIEIENGYIRLVKWESKSGTSTRLVLEESPLFYVFDQL